jgi:3-deoxy-8-phosphooctulonate synthase
MERESLCLQVAESLAVIAASLPIRCVFKASFDKANRTSAGAFRGPGLDEGLAILDKVRAATGLPVTTDMHLPDQGAAIGAVCDLIQIPAFLCRQTDLLLAAAATGKTVNVKKGQFVAPGDMRHAVGTVGSMVALMMMVSIVVRWEFGMSRFGFINRFHEAVGTAIRKRLGVAAEGSVLLSRWVDGGPVFSDAVKY